MWWLKRKTQRVRHRLASALIGRNVDRAIYPGPGQLTLIWRLPDNALIGHKVCGAYYAFKFQDGEIATVFEAAK